MTKHPFRRLRQRLAADTRRLGLVSVVATILLAGVTAPTAMAQPAPANDNFANATALSVGGSASLDPAR